MSTLNPIVDKFNIQLSKEFFPEEYTKEYDDFLFHKNGPLKTLSAHFHESIMDFTIPGINLTPLIIENLNNAGIGSKFQGKNETTSNIIRPGTNNLNNIYDSNLITLTFRNTMLNWMYMYTMLRSFYNRQNRTQTFSLTLTARDAAEIPMMNIIFTNCFISGLPGVQFNTTGTFGEAKTIDGVFTFEKMDVQFLLPKFDIIIKNI